MKKITKLLLTVALCALTIIAAGCGGDNKAADKKADPNAPVKIGVTAGPHAEIMAACSVSGSNPEKRT